MHTLHILGHSSGDHRTFGKALTGESLVRNLDFIHVGFELDNVGLEKKGGETFTFVPTSRLGRLIVFLAMYMWMHKK